MVKFIAIRIEKEADKSLEAGQAKYEAYFVNTGIYEKYRADVDTKLTADGYADVIVEA